MERTIPVDRLALIAPDGEGLSLNEVSEARARYGGNDIVPEVRRHWGALLKETLADPMLWFLAGTALLYGLTGQPHEAMLLLSSLIPIFGMDWFLHSRTQASTASLAGQLTSTARVRRAGGEVACPLGDLVPGDLAVIEAGEPYPADGVLVAGDGLQVDESALTGESLPVAKRPLKFDGDQRPPIGEAHWGLAGTRLLTGRATLRVIATGPDTLYGAIVRTAVAGSGERTPLQRGVDKLVIRLAIGAAILCAVLFAVRLMQGHGWLDALLSAATLAISAIPEEFPVVLTVFLGVGVFRLARRQALVRRAVAVENIGRVTCICSDKTGTLTLGRLAVAHLLPAGDLDESNLMGIAGGAMAPHSTDPLDSTLAAELLLRQIPPRETEPVAVFPFTEARRRETRIWAGAGGDFEGAMKGSPEVVLALCALSEGEREKWLAITVKLAGEGHKVIGVATRAVEASGIGEEPDAGWTFAGLIALEDPVRESAPEAVARCRAMGIRIIMVTGDHPATAGAIAREVGMAARPRVVTGTEAEALLASGGADAMRGVDVVARAYPAQKLALVEALRASGELVAVTGDGVNDVPALQAADIGIAMGRSGSQSAREVASIVLLDDNFRTIVGAIEEGRQLFQNMRLSFEYLLVIHLPLVLTAALVPLMGYPLLYLPVHIVWLELLIHPSALLGFQAHATSARVAAPLRGRHPTEFLGSGAWRRVVLASALLLGAILITVVRVSGADGGEERARALAMAILACGSAVALAALSRMATLAANVIVVLTLISAVVLIQTPSFATMLHLAPLTLPEWGIALGVALLTGIPVALRVPSRAVQPG